MTFAGVDGQSVTLTLEGYQFPHLTTADYDSNWLNVCIDACHPRGAWQASDACLLTYEVARLADWCRTTAKLTHLRQ